MSEPIRKLLTDIGISFSTGAIVIISYCLGWHYGADRGVVTALDTVNHIMKKAVDGQTIKLIIKSEKDSGLYILSRKTVKVK